MLRAAPCVCVCGVRGGGGGGAELAGRSVAAGSCWQLLSEGRSKSFWRGKKT